MKVQSMSLRLKPMAVIAMWLLILCCPRPTQAQSCVCGVGDLTPPTLTGVPSSFTVSCPYVSNFDTVTQGGGGCTGTWRTQTQGGWGASCNGNNPACYRNANFAAAFPGGLVVGCNFTLTLTTSLAVEVYLPCGGPAAPLVGNMVDPPCNNNVLAAQLVAATLNVGFDAYDPGFSPSTTLLGDLIVNNGPLAGLTVNQVLAEGNNALGGCGSIYTFSQIASALALINENFVDGTTDNGDLSCPGGPQTCGGVTATDNCDSSPDLECSETIVQGNCPNNYVIVHTWTATDNCGNVTTAVQTITVVDNTPPVLSGVPANTTASCDNIPPASTVTATDNCGSATVTMTETTVGNSCNSTIVRTWTATDECGNISTATQTITVSDNTPPVLSGVPGNTSAECDNVPPPATVTATDNCNATTVTMTETTSGNGCNGTITRTWTATDACGNSSSASQTITVSDNTAPVLSGVPGNTTASCDNVPAPANVTATDNCNTATVTMTQTTTGNSCNSTITRTWTATDACGNSSSASQTITVSDNTPPVLSGVPGNTTASCSNVPPPANVTATDNCNTATVTMTQTTTGNSCNSVITRTWTATDACGNSSSASQTITVSDNTPPVLSGVPANTTAQCGNVPPPATVTATDNCNTATVTMTQTTTGNSCNSVITRTWTATDACGNSSSASQTIVVTDNTPPTAICRNITVQANGNGSVTITPGAIDNGSSDNCGGSVTLSLNVTTVTCGTTTVILTVTDQCGNSSTCSATVTVPSGCNVEFNSCPNNIYAPCNANYCGPSGANVSWTVPTASAFSACAVNTCPTNTYISGFTYLGEFNGHRYYLSNNSSPWSTARNNAISNGGYLATINSAAENSFLTGILGNTDVWIGFNDAASEGNFVWTGGGGSGYTNWASGEPNNQTPSGCCYGADYAVLNGGNGNWYDRGSCDCHRYIMEVNCMSNTCPVTITRIQGPPSGSFFPGGSTTTITYVATTSGGDTDTCSFTVTVGNCPLNYCNSSGACSGYEWIRNVAVSNLNNWSGNNGGYENFTQYSANVVPGQCYPLTLRPGFSGQSYTENWKVWVDWNRDGDFYDSGETVFMGSGSSSVFGNLCVPASATNGTTRMRVSMQYGCSPAGPCSEFNYGEVEDYTIVVGAGVRVAQGNNGQPEGSAEAEAEAPIMAGDRDGLEMMRLYPNPVRDDLKVTFTSLQTGDFRVEVLTMEGKVVKYASGSASARDNEYTLRVDELSAGTYLLKLSKGNASATEKFVKQ